MKDLPHHIKKLNRQVIRSAHREEMEEDAFNMSSQRETMENDAFNAAFRKETTPHQLKKQKKEMIKQEREHRLLFPETPDAMNDLEKHRTPQTRDRTRQAPAAKSRRVAARAKASKKTATKTRKTPIKSRKTTKIVKSR